MGPKSNMTDVLTRGGKYYQKIEKHRGTPCDDSCKDWSDADASHEVPRIASVKK